MFETLMNLPVRTGVAVLFVLTAIIAIGSRSTIAYLFFIAAAAATLYYWTVAP